MAWGTTTPRLFPSAGLVLLILCSPDLPLFCTYSHSALAPYWEGRQTSAWARGWGWVASPPQDSWRYHHLSMGLKRSRGTLEPRGAEDDQTGLLCSSEQQRRQEHGHVGTVIGLLTTSTCCLGTHVFPVLVL